jgi:baculoviral IAP repeat-containing protein 2/3
MYKLYGTRLQTFVDKGWPSSVPINPNALAKAGFYYQGEKTNIFLLMSKLSYFEHNFNNQGLGDGVKCFHCDGGLKNWKNGDDPWVEHAKWFPKCAFLLDQQGREFVANVMRRQIQSPPKESASLLKNADDDLEQDSDPD